MSLKTFIKLILSLGLSGVFLWASFHRVNLHALWRYMQQARLSWLVVAAVLLILVNIPRAFRWRILMAPIAKDVPLWRAFWAILIGYATNDIFPRAGEVVRAVVVKQGREIPLSGLLATVLVERVLDLLTIVLFLGATLYFFGDEIHQIFPWIGRAGLVTFIISLVLLAGFVLLSAYGERTISPIQRLLSRVPRPLSDRIINILRSLFQGMGALRTVTSYIEIILSTLLINAIYVLTVYLAFFSFQLPQKWGLDMTSAFVVMVISTIGIIIPTPGGTGTYHYFCSQTLYHLYNVPLPEALAFATLLHGVGYFTFLFTGGPGLLRLVLRRGSGALHPDR